MRRLSDAAADLKRLRADRDYWRGQALAPLAANAAAAVVRQRPPPIPRAVWRRLVQLAHPERHGWSPASVAVERWLLAHQPPPYPPRQPTAEKGV